eukprot:CAMPEP_0197318858 /NCGR_PEP_ID=MMETSP0891-20130614/52725_1 /TAXON_ID=44058 ORGANISM="Aureoumbra lagunensis, Strain CCMP1510" /NCGR_SAMPLE_ID=MMETSP0891 /ASSEMBLY_ACC=CAM_ASM_000534 /LENGTH=954 /DNA_ID=CAMNT_0042809499 /DNA_START=272 /DNA_END=3136 /DNA_ORIENTATION=-
MMMILRGGQSKQQFSSSQIVREELYEAYNELHALASAYDKPLYPPAVVVIGAQSCGKSALVEALMGFQFNEVGGGTRTRRPIALRMNYNAACEEPCCYIDDERFEKNRNEAVSLREVQAFIQKENKRLERDAHRSFEPKDIIVRVEYKYCPNLVLIDTPGLLSYDNNENEHFETHQQSIRRNNDVLSDAWSRQAAEATELALTKCRVKEYVLLCVEDSADWNVDSVARRLCRAADPSARRTVIVNTKLDTKLMQFSRKQDIWDFLTASSLKKASRRAFLAGPFYTSVPSGRVITAWSASSVVAKEEKNIMDDDSMDDDEFDGYDFNTDAEYRSAVERASRADVSLIASRLGREKMRAVEERLGVAALRNFLESYVDEAYRSNVARVLPALEAERLRASEALQATQIELEQLSPRRLRRTADTVADDFCKALASAVAGAVSAPPEAYGENLADERVSAGAFLTLRDDDDDENLSMKKEQRRNNKATKHLAGGFRLRTAQNDLDRAVGHADSRLYGGAQYRRTLREFALAVRRSTLPDVSADEIANALGVGDSHDGADLVRAACVIAVHKARNSFEPQLDTLALRASHVMRRLPPAITFMMDHSSSTTSTTNYFSGGSLQQEEKVATTIESSTTHGRDVFLRIVISAYEDYARSIATKAAARCRDDLAAMTRFVTWDLAAAQTDAVQSIKSHLDDRDAVKLVEATAGPEDELTPEEDLVVKEWTKAQLESSDLNHVSEKKNVLSTENEEYGTTTTELLDDLKSAAAEEIHQSEASMHAYKMVEHLVKRIAAAWREHFARTVAVKFNCFFLMPFVDDFPLRLRQRLDDLFDTAEAREGTPALENSDQDTPDLDVANARRGLERKIQALQLELDANTKLHNKFKRIQRSLGIGNSYISSSLRGGVSYDDDDDDDNESPASSMQQQQQASPNRSPPWRRGAWRGLAGGWVPGGAHHHQR